MKYLLPAFILVFMFFPAIASAFTVCDIYVGYDLAEVGPFGQKLIHLLEVIASFLTIVGLGLAVIIIIISGISYMIAEGDEAKVTKARKMLTWGLVGAAIIIAAQFILCFVGEMLIDFYTI